MLGDDKVYIGGNLPRLDLDVDRFGYLDLEEEIEKLGYVSWKSISYKLTSSSNYVELKTNEDVLDMILHLGERHRVLEIFVDDGKKLVGEVNVESE